MNNSIKKYWSGTGKHTCLYRGKQQMTIVKTDKGLWLKCVMESDKGRIIEILRLTSRLLDHFTLIKRHSDPKVAIMDIVRRQSMFPIGSSIRLRVKDIERTIKA